MNATETKVQTMSPSLLQKQRSEGTLNLLILDQYKGKARCSKCNRSEECHTSEDESIKIEDDTIELPDPMENAGAALIREVASKTNDSADEEQAASEIAILKSRGSAFDARLAAAHEQMRSAEEDAAEWKRKYDIAVRETKAALEKAANVQERTNKETQLREDALREEFSSHLVVKEDEIKEKNRRIEYAEQCLTTLNLELKAADSKMQSYGTEISSLKLEIKVLVEKLETANAKAQSYDKEVRILEQEKIHLEQRYQSEFERFSEVQERCNCSEKECKRATKLSDRARADAVSAQKEKSEFQKLEIERLAQFARVQRHVERLYSDWDLLPPKTIKDPEAKKPATSFENLDYSVITDTCKGPQYPAKSCCDAFKEFACPFSDAINDLETDCASTMFSYINLYGKYPPGLFANECREDKNGLDCQNLEESKKSGGIQISATQSSFLMFTAGLIVLLLPLF
ncbi:hypothetical protein SADUNF_Sadunf19G0098600 [Salix dunnii]|uniref:GPI-anchored protein LLG1-like domain-containing protein n=1 Tax=Salix dunnii TaxID=1413687 RepID=A0A835J258_9ROSI|nr:hypothetical protein SADUNF_Sadunf19G0098600 [Salix dunnii]